MSQHLDLPEADRLRRAESRWLEQARERLRRPTIRPTSPSPSSPSSPSEESDR